MVKKYATQMTRKGPIQVAFDEQTVDSPVMRRPPPPRPAPPTPVGMLVDDDDEEVLQADDEPEKHDDESLVASMIDMASMLDESDGDDVIQPADGRLPTNVAARIERDLKTTWTLERAFEARMSATMSSYGAQVQHMRSELNCELRAAQRDVVLHHLADSVARGAAHERAIDALSTACRALTEKANASDTRAARAEARLDEALARISTLEARCTELEAYAAEDAAREERRSADDVTRNQWQRDNQIKIELGARASRALDALTERLSAALMVDGAAELARAGDRTGARETAEQWTAAPLDPSTFLQQLSTHGAGGGEALAAKHGVKLDAAREARRRSLDERDDEVAVAPASPPAEDEVAADAILALFRRVSTLEVDKAEGSKVLQLSDRLKNCVAAQDAEKDRVDRRLETTKAALDSGLKTIATNLDANVKVTLEDRERLQTLETSVDAEFGRLKESVGNTFKAVRSAIAPELTLLGELDEFRAVVEDEYVGRIAELERTRARQDAVDLKADKEDVEEKAYKSEVRAVVDSVRTLAITVKSFGDKVAVSESIARNAGAIAKKADALVKEVRKRQGKVLAAPGPVGTAVESPTRRVRRKRRDEDGLLVGGYEYEEGDDEPTVRVELPKLASPGLSLSKHRLEWTKPSTTEERMAESTARIAEVRRKKRPARKSSLARGQPQAEEGSSWIKG